jgi:hypothetical protein
MFIGALIIASSSVKVFGLNDFGLGCILSSFNCVILFFSMTWSFQRWQREQRERRWRPELSPEQLKLLQSVMNESANDPSSPNSERGPEAIEDANAVVARSTELLTQFLISPKDVRMAHRIGVGRFPFLHR